MLGGCRRFRGQRDRRRGERDAQHVGGRASAIDEARANQLLDEVETDLPPARRTERLRLSSIGGSMKDVPARLRCVSCRPARSGPQSIEVGGYRVVRRLGDWRNERRVAREGRGAAGFERTVVLKILLSQYQNDERVLADVRARGVGVRRPLAPSIRSPLRFLFARQSSSSWSLEFVDGPSLHGLLRGMLRSARPAARRRFGESTSPCASSRRSAAAHSASSGGVSMPGHPSRREPRERARSVGWGREARRLRRREGHQARTRTASPG